MKSVVLNNDDVHIIDDIHITFYKDETKTSLMMLMFENKMKKDFQVMIERGIQNNKRITLYYHEDTIHSVKVEFMPGCPTVISSSYASLDSAGEEIYIEN